MSHALDFSKGFAAIAYRKHVPWHGFGQMKPEDEQWSIDDWIKNAGLDFTVESSPAFFEAPDQNGDSVPMRFDNRVILYRSDNLKALNMVSESNYKVRQPREIIEAFSAICETGDYQMEVAGAIQDGRKLWALVSRTGAAEDIGSGDIVKGYQTLMESYDGSLATTAFPTNVYVVCQNTIRAALSEKGRKHKQKHSQVFDRQVMLDSLGEFDATFKASVEKAKAMTKRKFSDDMATRFFAKLYCPDAFDNIDLWDSKSDLDFDNEKVTTNAKNTVAALLEAFHDMPGGNLPTRENTLFGAFNAVTYFQDHEARTKEGKRWESALVGNGGRVKDEALILATSLLG